MKLVTVLLLLVSASASAETFRLHIEFTAVRGCELMNQNSCIAEKIDIGNVDLDVTNGFQSWDQKINFDGIDYQFNVLVAKVRGGFFVRSAAGVTFGGTETYSSGFVEVADDQSLVPNGTATTFLPVGRSMATANIRITQAK